MAKKKFEKEVRKVNSRPPVVVVLGHVDHGKTTLLDKIRKSRVAEKEPGMITQRIGVYQVEVEAGKEKKKIIFIDTPGHEAFAKMRQRGAQITDIAILVVAADDGVMPQTKESIQYLKETKTPFIVALNKIDLPAADPKRVKSQLADAGVLVEELGGKVVCIPISARTGQGIKELLEMILLLAEMEELKENLQGPLKLAVVESKLDSRKGPVATVIVQSGTLRQGDTIELGGIASKVRGILNEQGQRVAEASSSTPVEILGLKKVPMVGEVAHEEGKVEKEPGEPEGGNRKLRIILKADTSGSLEAILQSLPKQAEIIFQGVGEVNESDILLAKTSHAIILGFNLNPSASVKKLAETEGVILKIYNVIYELLEELGEAILAQATVQIEEKLLGKAKIVAEFPFDKERVAGCQIIEGRISRGDMVKVMRGDEEIGQTKVKSLRHLKEDVPKAEVGSDCGILFATPLDFQPGDVLLSYKF